MASISVAVASYLVDLKSSLQIRAHIGDHTYPYVSVYIHKKKTSKENTFRKQPIRNSTRNHMQNPKRKDSQGKPAKNPHKTANNY